MASVLLPSAMLGLSVRGGGQGAAAYEFTNTEAETLVAAFDVEPDDTRKGVIDTLVGALKTAGVWSKLDLLYVLAAHDAQAARSNWKNPGTFDLTAAGSPTFATDRGYTGDGAAASLSTGFNPATNGVQFTLNSAHFGYWARTTSASNNFDAGVNNLLMRAKSGTAARIRINSGTNLDFTDAVSNPSHTMAVRRAAGAQLAFRNGAAVTSDSATSTSVTSATLTLLAGGGAFSDRQCAAAHIGGALSDAEALAAYNALAAYMTAVGA